MRTPTTPLLTILALSVAILAPNRAVAQEDSARSTYRVILYLAEDGAPAEMSLQRLNEVWSEEEGSARLGELLSAGRLQRLEDVTVLPGRQTPALRLGNVTVRVKGAYRAPGRTAMFLRVEMDGGSETLVKEMISEFDETIVLAYPLAEGDRSVVALIVPIRM